MKTSTLYKNVILFISFLNLVLIKTNDYDDLENYDTNGYYDNSNDLNIVSISYELSYDDTSIVRVLIKTYYDLALKERSSMSMAKELYSLVIDSYYYQVNYNNYSIFKNGPNDLNELNSTIEFKLKEFLFFTELVKEAGDINE